MNQKREQVTRIERVPTQGQSKRQCLQHRPLRGTDGKPEHRFVKRSQSVIEMRAFALRDQSCGLLLGPAALEKLRRQLSGDLDTIVLKALRKEPQRRYASAERFSDDLENPTAMMDAFEQHNAQVRAGVPAARLLEWTPSDAWEPICERLGVAVPMEPFPVTNTTNETRAIIGLPPLPQAGEPAAG